MKLLWTAKVQGHTKKQSRKNIKKLFVEYQEALTEYHEALTKTSCKFVSRFRPHKVRQKRPKDDAKPGQGQAQMPWNGTKKVAQGHPKHTKWVPNWSQNVPRSPKRRPVVKSSFFYMSLDRFRVPARLHFRSKIQQNCSKKPSGNGRWKSITKWW